MPSNKYPLSRRSVLKGMTVGGVGSLVGCIGDDEVAPDTFRLGVYGPLTGPVADIGEAKRTSWEVIADLWNEAGGIDGTEIELFYGDSESEPARGRSAVSRLIDEEDIDMLGGGFHSDVALAVIELAHANDLPFIIDEPVSGAINQRIVEDSMTTVFKTSPPSEAYGFAWGQIVQDFQEAGIANFEPGGRIALIGEDTSYGITVMDETARHVEDAGWEIISEDEVPLDETDFTALLARIRDAEPDVVWAVQTATAATGALAEQFSELDFGDAVFMHNFGLTVGEARERAGPAADGSFTIVHPAAIPTLLQELNWEQAWEEGTDLSLTSSAATSMTNTHVISTVVESAGGVDAFRELSPEEFESLVVDHDPIQGGIGFVDYQDDHQAVWGSAETIPTLCYQVVDGELVLVWPFEFAEAEIDETFYQ